MRWRDKKKRQTDGAESVSLAVHGYGRFKQVDEKRSDDIVFREGNIRVYCMKTWCDEQ